MINCKLEDKNFTKLQVARYDTAKLQVGRYKHCSVGSYKIGTLLTCKLQNSNTEGVSKKQNVVRFLSN